MSREVAEVLRKALVAFGPNGECWGQAMSIAGEGKLCTNVVVSHVLPSNHPRHYELFVGANEAVQSAGGFKHGSHAVDWNDAPERTFADVKALFEKAIAQEENDSTTAAPAAKEKH